MVQADPTQQIGLHVRNAGAQIFGTMIGVGMLNAVAMLAGLNGTFLIDNVPLRFGHRIGFE